LPFRRIKPSRYRFQQHALVASEANVLLSEAPSLMLCGPLTALCVRPTERLFRGDARKDRPVLVLTRDPVADRVGSVVHQACQRPRDATGC
jgi:hypothetical protein